jgi:hypothetical protein
VPPLPSTSNQSNQFKATMSSSIIRMSEIDRLIAVEKASILSLGTNNELGFKTDDLLRLLDDVMGDALCIPSYTQKALYNLPKEDPGMGPMQDEAIASFDVRSGQFAESVKRLVIYKMAMHREKTVVRAARLGNKEVKIRNDSPPRVRVPPRSAPAIASPPARRPVKGK